MGLREWLGFDKPVEKPIVKVTVPTKTESSPMATLIDELNKKNNADVERQKENKPVTYHVSGVWARKPLIEHATKQDREQEKLIIGLHPYTIVNIKEWSDLYIKLYGQAEFDVLKASGPNSWNMVVSNQKIAWVKGGIWYPVEKEETTVELLPGNEWYQTPFGRGQRPISSASTTTSTSTPTSATVDMAAIKQAAFEGALEGTKAALAEWQAKMGM